MRGSVAGWLGAARYVLSVRCVLARTGSGQPPFSLLFAGLGGGRVSGFQTARPVFCTTAPPAHAIRVPCARMCSSGDKDVVGGHAAANGEGGAGVRLVVLVGIPGSGKSTIAKRYIRIFFCVCVCVCVCMCMCMCVCMCVCVCVFVL